jgi:hypothetical protein
MAAALALLGGPGERSHGYKVCIGNLANVRCAQRNQSASSTGSCYEFDLQAVLPVDFDDCPEIAAPESMIREVAVENDGV